MKIYCSHSLKDFNKASNYNYCRLCTFGWYSNDSVPMVVVGYTEPYEVDKDYLNHLEEKDLSKKKFTRCVICRDLLEKRKHRLCKIKNILEILKRRHKEYVENILNVVRGFRR